MLANHDKNTFWELLFVCICSRREYGKNILGPSFYFLFDFWGGLHDKVGFWRLEQPKWLQRERERGVNRSCSSLFIYIYVMFMSTKLINSMHNDIKTIIQLRLFIRKMRKLSISNTNISWTMLYTSNVIFYNVLCLNFSPFASWFYSFIVAFISFLSVYHFGEWRVSSYKIACELIWSFY